MKQPWFKTKNKWTFFFEEKQMVEMRYVESFFFWQGTFPKIIEYLNQMMDDHSPAIWERLFNISYDGPNINKKIHQDLDAHLKKKVHKGLIPFLGCTLHVMHNCFHKGIKTFLYKIKDFAFDLHAWFKHSPCKEEDFKNLEESIELPESFFF